MLAAHAMCQACHTQPATTVDHVRNLAAGGSTDDANLQALCQPCHDSKSHAEAVAAQHRRPDHSERHPGLR